MSFYDDASLVFLPSGGAGKDTKAYSIKPTNGDGDFTFSRGSNLTATRVDSNGLIEKGRENLLLQSNQFNTTWATTNSSVTSGQSGYDGSSDAWLLEATSAGTSRYIRQGNTNSGVNTFSCYAKAGTTDFIRLQITSSNTAFTYFDLNNGTIGNEDADTIDSTIEDVGSEWYRISVAASDSSISQVRIYVAQENTSNVNQGDNVYIQDAQLEIGLVATEYIESGATTGLAGILEDSPRFDYSGGASCPSLLLEPSRTNEIGQSEYLDSHTKNASTLVNFSNVTCPIEGVKVSQIIDTNSGGNGRLALFESVNLTSSNTYTASIFAKADRLNFIYFSFDGAAVNSDKRVWFNLSTGQVGTESGGATGSIESFGDGWYRCIMVFTADNTGIVNTKIAPAEEDNNINVDRDGNSSVLATAMQLEQGSYPTSYIPNHSGSGSVTREADVNTLLNQSGVIGQTAGTILFDAYFDEADKVNFSISDSTSSNYILIDTTSGKQVFARVQQGGSTQATISTSGSFFAEGDRLKCAIAYDDRDMAFYINGTQVGTAAPNLIPACDDIRFSRWNGALAADQRVNRVLLFDTRISNNNLITLTS